MPGQTDFAAAVDVFHHHDGVIHQHPDAESQTAQGKDVQRDAGKIHQRHGKEQADGNGHRHHKGGAEIPEKEQKHKNGQHRADDQIFRHGFADAVNIDALIGKRRNRHRRIGFGNPVKGFVDIFRRLRSGGVGLFHERDQHTVVAVDFGINFSAIVDQGNIGHIA